MNNSANDLTGKTFGRLTVLGQIGKNEKGNTLWKCSCSCGKEVIVVGERLNRGLVGSCGCVFKKEKRDLTGSKIGKLTVIEPHGTDEKGKTLWKCVCECGGEKIAKEQNLINGDVYSCGCGIKNKRKTATADIERSI